MNGRKAKQQRRDDEQAQYQARLDLAVRCAISLAGYDDRDEIRRISRELLQLDDLQLINTAEFIAISQSPLRNIAPGREQKVTPCG